MKNENELLNFLKHIDDVSIISKTSVSGKITYANQLFCDISGYSQEELIGKPHNIVRHPDMPSETFKEMWETIKAGKVWSGKVTNRSRNGLPYITYTTITPIFNNNEITEYLSLRFLITEEELKNKQFRINVSKLLREYKIKLSAYEKNKNNAELKNVLDENSKLREENKKLIDTFEMRVSANNRKLLTEMKALRNNDLNYQKTVDKVNKEKEQLELQLKELNDVILTKNEQIKNLTKSYENLEKIANGRLDLLNELEKK